MEEGPYLSDILALAGVTEFTEVTLTGSSNPVTLTFEQVDENTILDFNNHGTMKLSTTYIPKAELDKGCCGDYSEVIIRQDKFFILQIQLRKNLFESYSSKRQSNALSARN